MLKSYGVKEATAPKTEAERHAEEVRLLGYTVVRQLVGAPVLEEACVRLDRLYASQAAALGGEPCLQAINDANIIRCPLAEDLFFLDFAASPRLLAVARALLGDYITLQQQNGVVNPPSTANYQAGWHRDLPYQHFVASRPLAISALFCLDPFNAETGGTYILPASHKTEPFPSEDYVLSHQAGVVAEPGDVLVFDSMLFHRAGENRSGRPRRGLNHVLALPFLKQQISLPRALGGRLSDDPFYRKFLGYESEPGDSAFAWRSKRLSKPAA
jgi:ectoine hydroxylase-related dioxygenase (phytanoyl-CoA dioxygenase family)